MLQPPTWLSEERILLLSGWEWPWLCSDKGEILDKSSYYPHSLIDLFLNSINDI